MIACHLFQPKSEKDYDLVIVVHEYGPPFMKVSMPIGPDIDVCHVA